ncbi:hypothetical protein [Aeromonas hydrophila]|uniref:hypothetical protein n=1 Tax=Aeromonas hydrophila TaxID=644 RepID=UPI002B47D956|nr:hypothetical protein [Aeromonas hydrophila]
MIFSVASFGVSQSRQYFDWIMDNHHQLHEADLKSLFDVEFTKTDTFKELDSLELGKYISASFEYALKNLIDVYHGKKREYEAFGYDIDAGNREHAKLFMRALAQHKSFTVDHAEVAFDFFRKYYQDTMVGSLNVIFNKSQHYNDLSSELVEFIQAKRFTSDEVNALFQDLFLKLKEECLVASQYDQLSACALPSMVVGFSKLLKNTVGAVKNGNGNIASFMTSLGNFISHLEQPGYAMHSPLQDQLHYHLQSCHAALSDDRCLHSIAQSVRSEHRPINENYNLEHLFHDKNISKLNEIADELCVLNKYSSPKDSDYEVSLMMIPNLVHRTNLTEDDVDNLIQKFNSTPIYSIEVFFTSLLKKRDLSDVFKSKILIDGITNGNLTQMPYKFGQNASLSFGVIYDVLKHLHSYPFRFGDNLQSNIGRFIMEMQPTSSENYIALFNKVDALCNHDDFFVTPGKNPDFLRRQAAFRIVTDVYYPSLFAKDAPQTNMSMNVLSYCFSSITSADCKLIGTKNLNDLMLQYESLHPGTISRNYSAIVEVITSHILNAKVDAMGIACNNLSAKPKTSI